MSTEQALPASGQFVRANGLDIHYVEMGTGAPLLLLHGGTAMSSSWQDHAPTFARHFRVFALDSRAHGRTKHTGGDLSYGLLAEDVAAFVAALGLSKPMICGYSDGGQAALEVGMRYPELAGGLVLGGTTPRFTDAYYRTLHEWGYEAPGKVDYARVEPEMGEYLDYLKTEHAALGGPDYWRELIGLISTLWLTPLEYTAADFAKVTAPTLVLVGDRDEAIPVEQAVELYRALPNAELAVIPNSDHGGAIGEPFAPLALDFLLRQQATA